ncbi:RNA polymerase subunit sigma-70 [[Clostridium] symbiosum]|uniref:RNA polymerase subunit sigma-70 n=1 Tax=Clostridium symbiosum TaxID=1512 RepID=UPI001D06FD32|nr:RNA polymerase subunit sigma-70 [[Clostridium] symbiosum]MCB6610209.1 RNA polymerase subunit sigma-70 [[Clostridium] symbiosum]MCB6933545.1 RNA polymerase subunit sigma-70 [[Clostridium] symbiosum]
MEKEILNQYIDACELIKETEKEIQRLRQRRKVILQDSVKGSMHEFPYAAQSFHIEGLAYTTVQTPSLLDDTEELLEERIAAAAEIKVQVEAWLNTVPQRLQRIIRMKIFEEMTWAQVAVRMGRKATPDGIRKEFENFLKVS